MTIPRVVTTEIAAQMRRTDLMAFSLYRRRLGRPAGNRPGAPVVMPGRRHDRLWLAAEGRGKGCLRVWSPAG